MYGACAAVDIERFRHARRTLGNGPFGRWSGGEHVGVHTGGMKQAATAVALRMLRVVASLLHGVRIRGVLRVVQCVYKFKISGRVVVCVLNVAPRIYRHRRVVCIKNGAIVAYKDASSCEVQLATVGEGGVWHCGIRATGRGQRTMMMVRRKESSRARGTANLKVSTDANRMCPEARAHYLEDT
ncbi:hypothetical protein BOTBODRAFT_33965 [Botryobasidium botryosum FD-172 SS1]|uniref:Uncharacterized protein n=1 Tax=Botryobasidium botryosum (strain FD-172 SS1) TaxID=930990 RepID=A0A067MC01_BOTB1|nr:hypothetical protein BOTBODRAFT_33965 [Botryobasidium botryosum FD-172 SS1]